MNNVAYDHDSMAKRDRAARWGFLILTVAVVIFPLTAVGIAVGGVIDFHSSKWIFGTAGFCFGVFSILKLFPRYWIVVPQTSAFVTTNQFAPKGKNPNIPYGPGGHPAFPWELRAESGNITLDILTVSYHEKVPTKESEMIVDGTVQFKFSLGHITTVVGIDITTIEQGFIAQINEWLSQRLSDMDGAEAKNSIAKLRREIETEFEETRKDNLLEEYGVLVTGFQLSSIDFPKAVQDVRDTIDEAKRIGEGIWLFMGFKSERAFASARKSGKITEQDVARARDDFLAASKNITKTVQRLDITGGEGLAAAALAGMVGGKGGKS